MAGGHGYGDDDGELRSVAGGETEERGGGRSRERGRSERGSGTSPWRREEVGEAATAKQEVAGGSELAASRPWWRGREGGEGERGPESEGVEGGLCGVAWRRHARTGSKGRPPARSRRWPASARGRPARSCFGARGRKMTGSWAAQ